MRTSKSSAERVLVKAARVVSLMLPGRILSWIRSAIDCVDPYAVPQAIRIFILNILRLLEIFKVVFSLFQ